MPEPILRVSEVMRPLLGPLNEVGRPDNWPVASVVREEWGTVEVDVGPSVNVTTLRGIPTQVKSWSYQEPWGYGPAEISFPQISPYDTLGSGDLAWFVQGFNVGLFRRKPDGTRVSLWHGFAASWESEMSESGYSMSVHLSGVMFQAALEPMPPGWDRGERDIGTVIRETLNNFPGRRWGLMAPVTTGITTRNRGSWNTVLDYLGELLSTAYTTTMPRKQWVVTVDSGRIPELKVKDTTTEHWTISNGQRGMMLRESSDVTASTNVIFGEGTDTATGCRWRNTRYPGNGVRPEFLPLIGRDENVDRRWDEANEEWDANPGFDPTKLRVARYENFGSGVTRTEATLSALAELDRDANPGWTGTLTMTADPEQGSRFDIRAGDNIAIRHHHGWAKRLFRVVEANVDLDSLTVTLNIDTNARDKVTLVGLQERDNEAKSDPARRLNPPRRKSRSTQDEHPIFDCESGAGKVKPFSAPGGQWLVVRVPMAAYGTIVRSYFTTSPATTYACGVFDRPVSAGTLSSLVGNPLGSEDPWDPKADELSDAGLQVAWGGSEQKGGYYPSQQGKAGATVTGRMLDDASWEYASHAPPWMYLAFYPAGTTTVNADFDAAPES